MLVDTVLTQSQQKSTPRLHWRFVGGASQPVRSTCKSFRAPPFMLLIVPYNSVYYNHVHNYYAMVGWSVWGSKQKEGFVLAKRGVCVGKKSALWPCEILNCFMVNNQPARIKGRA